MTAEARTRSFDFKEYLRTLKFCLYTMRRPLDGFWDLIHEKRGSLAAAHTLVVIAILVEIMWVVLTSFQFITVNMETFNAWWMVGMTVAPILLFSVANWCLTTLFDGKGRVSDIYMGYAYALAPQIIIRAIQIPLSHVITHSEGAIFWMLSAIGTGWFFLLILCAMKEIHDYSFGKAVLTCLLSILAIGIMVFIFVIFFAVVSDGVAYFVSIGQEVMLRVQRG
ncbi:MAG: YIP1 family protein [Defluviitaleaceae bacterium]|nr:YIP1 family protein [Defluviitaleaceae bacterium]